MLGNNRLNTVRVNFTREDVAFANPGFNGNGQDQAALEPSSYYLTFVDQQSAVAQARVNNAYQFDDTMSWFIPGSGGDHDVKFGGAVRIRRRAIDGPGQPERHVLLQDRPAVQRERSPHLSRASAGPRARRAEPLQKAHFVASSRRTNGR